MGWESQSKHHFSTPHPNKEYIIHTHIHNISTHPITTTTITTKIYLNYTLKCYVCRTILDLKLKWNCHANNQFKSQFVKTYCFPLNNYDVSLSVDSASASVAVAVSVVTTSIHLALRYQCHTSKIEYCKNDRKQCIQFAWVCAQCTGRTAFEDAKHEFFICISAFCGNYDWISITEIISVLIVALLVFRENLLSPFSIRFHGYICYCCENSHH